MSITTQAPYWLSGIGGAVLTYGVCAWRHRQRITDLFHRMHRIDRARQAAEQLALQARKQIEQLQKEITAQHRARAEALSQRRRAEAMAEVNLAFEREASVRPSHPVHFARPALPPDGFADTQPI